MPRREPGGREDEMHEKSGDEVKRTWRRLGEWTRAERTTKDAQGHDVPYTAVVVSYKGKTWERPDTKEGRAEITAAIRGVEDREILRSRILNEHGRVSKLRDALHRTADFDATTAVARAVKELEEALKSMASRDVKASTEKE